MISSFDKYVVVVVHQKEHLKNKPNVSHPCSLLSCSSFLLYSAFPLSFSMHVHAGHGPSPDAAHHHQCRVSPFAPHPRDGERQRLGRNGCAATYPCASCWLMCLHCVLCARTDCRTVPFPSSQRVWRCACCLSSAAKYVCSRIHMHTLTA